MKRTILAALAALLLAVPAVQAQKLNKEAIQTKLSKSDADIADAKKNAKAATWINRGKAYYEAASAPVKDVFVSMEAMMLKLAVGDPASVAPETLAGVEYEAWKYPYFTAYLSDGKVATFVGADLFPGALVKAVEAYSKAYELDPKQAEKIKAGLKSVSDFAIQQGETLSRAGMHAAAADSFELAYAAQSSPAYGEKADGMCLYNAGLLRTMDGAANPASFVRGADLLNRSIESGYTDSDGNVYYYLFHCYYGQREKDPEALGKAKQALLTGIEKFPKSERIMDGLINLYTSEEGVGDPQDLVNMLEQSIAANPESVDLWFGRGRLFYKLENYDESIASFKKVVELKPDLFDGFYWLGTFYAVKGDAMQNAMTTTNYTSQGAYDADLKAVNDVYRAALPYLEKANELKAGDANTLRLLKSIYFRLRDEEGMMDKFNYYNPLWKQAEGME